MVVAILSDIHSNMEALSALPQGFDELWVLGDLVNYGPDPAPVIEYVQARASVVVRGNHDHAVGFNEDPRCSEAFREMAAVMKEYTRSVLSPAHKQFLRELPLRASREMNGLRVAFCHAIPSDPLFSYRLADADAWPDELRRADADTLFVGHTHVPFVRKLDVRRVVNPGSLGQPKTGDPRARYAVLQDDKVELKALEYPFEETIRKIASLPIPATTQQLLASVLRNGGLPQGNAP